MLFQSSKCQNDCLSPSDKPETMLATLTIATAAEEDIVLPEVYKDFADVFNKKQAEVFPSHRSYDCQIDLVRGALLPSSTIYAL